MKNPEQKFDQILESYINGQKTQAKEQFKKLPKQYRKLCLKYLDANQSESEEVKQCKLFLIDNF